MKPPSPSQAAAPVLVVDSSIQGVAMALVDAARPDQPVLWQGAHPQNMGAVAAISALAAEGLAATALTVDQLQGVAVAIGPGSFTGVKVGLAFAYGLSAGRAEPLPMLGLSALDGAARSLVLPGRDVVLFLPATRTHGYVAFAGTETKAAALVELTAVVATSLPVWAAKAHLAVVGSWPLLADLARQAGVTVAQIAPSEVCQRAIHDMAGQAAKAWPASFSGALPAPRYLRLSTAEERLAILKEG